ncbi:MAG: putative 4-hydroxybenzoate polyprenyltransferase [Caldimicrobium sp.]|nr:putative 4-hydroxybenzoate polyprenyltransferase [Caldimicrobium sp.]MCX7874058.1 putative 4-hydroxybenzoate polyprenyltransferase [Caldimicrobium sp.]MDW8093882.1 UbiA-like polyprenyltransferase [Caldimicrobium sp.]
MLRRFNLYSELLKLEHTIFALPFALASIIILMREIPPVKRIIFIVLALVMARLTGMAFNRLLDREFDAQNPRTRLWPHASGFVKTWEIKIILSITSLLFIISCAFINKLALLLSPFVIGLLFIYPLAKRFTYYPHFILGIVYFLIPVAVDIALNERIGLMAVLLGLGMAFWVAGFDILYSLQDYEFDLKMGLKSIPVRFGIKRAITLARVLHLLTLLSLLLLGVFYYPASAIYFIGLLVMAGFLWYEHTLISERDLSKLNKAFFTVNGIISILFFLLVLLDRLLRSDLFIK